MSSFKSDIYKFVTFPSVCSKTPQSITIQSISRGINKQYTRYHASPNPKQKQSSIKYPYPPSHQIKGNMAMGKPTKASSSHSHPQSKGMQAAKKILYAFETR
jgi:hypothetical protein